MLRVCELTGKPHAIDAVKKALSNSLPTCGRREASRLYEPKHQLSPASISPPSAATMNYQQWTMNPLLTTISQKTFPLQTNSVYV